MTSVGALPPTLPRSRQSAAASAEGGDAFAAMLAGFGAVTPAPTANAPVPQGPAVTSGPMAAVPTIGPLGAGMVQAGPVQTGPVQTGPVQAGLVVGLGPTPVPAAPIQATPVPAAPVQATPIQAAPVQATPVPAAPIPATPIQAAPVPAASVAAAAIEAGAVLPGAIVTDAIVTGQIQAGATQAGAIQPGVPEPEEAAVVPAPPLVPPPPTGSGGPVTSPAGLAPDPRPALPATGVPTIEIPTAAPAAVTATAAPVPVAAPAVAPSPDSTAAAPVDTTAAPTTAEAGVDLPNDQDAGDQTGSEPEPELQAPLLDAVRTDQPQPADVRLIGADQAVGALGEQRRVDTVAPVTAPAPAAPPPPPAAQVFQLLTPLLEGPDGTHTMSLQLHPEELGAVQVDVALLRGEITLALHARDIGAQDALRAALPMLRADLEASGLTTSVSVDGGRADQQPGERPARPGGSLPGGSGNGAPAGPPVPSTSAPDAALDVRM